MLFTGTDSLVYKIKTNDVYEYFYEDKILSDFSDYPKDSQFYCPVNTKVVGVMKDETIGKIISEFVELKSKIHSLVLIDREEIKKVKDVNKNVVKNIRHKKYTDVLFGRGLVRHKMKRIESKFHRIRTYDV